MHADIEYQITIETSAGDFEFTTTDRTYTWTNYGAELGASSNAETEVFAVRVTGYNPLAGYSYESSVTAEQL
jgi:hypothetical protein